MQSDGPPQPRTVAAPIPANDAARVQDLNASRLLQGGVLPDLDELIQMCQQVFRVDIAAVSLIDDKFQWFKSQVGLNVKRTPRDVSFCSWALYQGDHVLVPDALEDPRFEANPLVLDSPYIRFYSGIPLYSKRGHVLGTLCVIDSKPREFSADDITMQRYLARQAELLIEKFEIERMAMMDSLTGLYNRRYFEQRAVEQLNLARRTRQPLALAVLDIDDFKAINDTFGHAAGDRILVELAHVMKRVLRGSDVITRADGEEFHLMLPNTPAAIAQKVADRLRTAVAECQYFIKDKLNLSASVGLAALNPDDVDIQELIRRANAAMHEAKRSGKNRTCVA